MNLKFIKEILTSEFQYYLVSVEGVTNYHSRSTSKDDIILIGVPHGILIHKADIENRGIKVGDLPLKTIESINNMSIQCNIYLNALYAPFQRGLTVSSINWFQGVNGDIRQFLVKALAMGGKGELSDFTNLLIDKTSEFQ